MEQNIPTPSSQKLAAALAAAQSTCAGANGGHSLAEMAQRDLDAALQLLADRAQYITGASGAAIALRRDGRKDMLCRASAGSNAPELGALLSTEFGLSGESVRTRQLLRCDDAERDARVNREVCRQLGIASVVVMPVVNDDQVLGVFELFSGKANAFGERDLSAVQRLSEMVETAVRLAHATEKLPEQLKEAEQEKASASNGEVHEGQFLSDLVVIEEPEAPVARSDKDLLQNAAREVSPELPTPEVNAPPIAAISNVVPETAATSQAVPTAGASPAATSQTVSARPTSSPSDPELSASAPVVTPKKTLFWSAALDLDAEAAKPAEDDQTHVPPVMRGLHKCVACGFPVSAGRMLCVECEEKKWRGQLRTSKVAAQSGTKPIAPVRIPAASEPPKSGVQAFAAAAPSMAKSITLVPAAVPTKAVSPELNHPALVATPAAPVQESKKETPASSLAASTVQRSESTTLQARNESASPDFVLTAGLESQSWLGRNKYVVGVLLAIAAVAAAVFFLR